jgi:hypothetical protein
MWSSVTHLTEQYVGTVPPGSYPIGGVLG